MACRFAPARSLTARGISIFSELGLELRLALAREFTAVVPLLAGDLDAAERDLRLGCDVAARLDAKAQLPFVHGMLADVLCRMGRYGEAETFVREAKEAAGGDVFAEATWRRAAAKIDAARGDVDQAAAMLYDAAAIVRDTDALALQADVQADLAGVLGRLGRNEEASQAVDAAAALYRRKEHAAALGQLASTFAPVRDGLTS